MATLKDIAQRCGVSTATVSYVVNKGPRQVLPETRERVLTAIADLNYHPNAHARGLRGMKTNTIGVVFPHVVSAPFENAYFGPVLAGIIDVATQHQKATMLFTAFDWEEADTSAPQLCDGRCDGFIVLAPLRRSQLVADLKKRKVAVVVVGTHPDGQCVDTVDAANEEGARLAVNHLAALGHRRIAIATDWDQRTSSTERLAGYKTALKENGLRFDESLVLAGAGASQAGFEKVFADVLSDPASRPTAIFCVQDGIADLALRVSRELGIRVPQQLSIVGFDDVGSASSFSPPLTTVRQPMREIGFRAAELLCERMGETLGSPRDIYFDVQLIERETTAPLPAVP